jgi:hypothetical protein
MTVKKIELSNRNQHLSQNSCRSTILGKEASFIFELSPRAGRNTKDACSLNRLDAISI